MSANRWEWFRPKWHATQPVLEWWFEQVAIVIVVRIAKRAHRRGDQATLGRMLDIALAGARGEQ